MQQSLRSSDGTDPIFNKVFSNAITAIMVRKAGSEQVDSEYHEEWILKRIGMIRTALKGLAQQWHSNFKRPLIINNRKHKLCYF